MFPNRPLGALETYRQRAYQRVAFTQKAQEDWIPFTDGTPATNWRRTLTGAGANTGHDQTVPGGVLNLFSGSVSGNSVELLKGDTVGSVAQFHVFFGATLPKFYVAARKAVTTAIDAQTQSLVVGRGNSTGGYTWKFGVIGPTSTAKFAAKINIGSPSTITSTVNIDTAFHTHELWCDGVNTFYVVDDEPQQSVVKIPDELSLFGLFITNGTTLTSRQLSIDWALCISEGP